MNITYPVLLKDFPDGQHPIMGTADPTKLTAQEVLNISFEHVINQGEPAFNTDNNCCFTGTPAMVKFGEEKKLLACAAAPFLPKKYMKLSPEFRANTTWGLIYARYIGKGNGKHTRLITALQTCHDEAGALSKCEPEKGDFMHHYVLLIKELLTKYKNLTFPNVPVSKGKQLEVIQNGGS